ncbi:hypothetical protein CCHR01_00324 [Colletotrichum chrysophilum]|uniref:Uncharacterized protein n=1 Tax=Colletotrichum chrysophilum TaxID=1836956 RepID=A0AAD9EUC8_9PEZI|nr:hypothetical protein CCHR01_00324 [Colletotrichum chrysophilum]
MSRWRSPYILTLIRGPTIFFIALTLEVAHYQGNVIRWLSRGSKLK